MSGKPESIIMIVSGWVLHGYSLYILKLNNQSFDNFEI